MSRAFEELDHAETRFGELILRRRRVLSLDTDVYEVKLGGEFLMSSLVNTSEIALADRAVARLEGSDWDIVVGGLGLGYTAGAALDHGAVASVLVIEYLEQVIGWHERRLVPLGERLMDDPRCRIVQADFFERARGVDGGFDSEAPGKRYDAVLLDIDHAPTDLLHESHGDFYTAQGFVRLREQLKPGGVFAVWSADPPDESFTARLTLGFPRVQAHAVSFPNPLLEKKDVNTVYVAVADAE